MEAGAAPCHLTLTLWDSHRNKQRGGETEQERERQNGGVVNNNHPPPEPELLLSLFARPTFWFQTTRGKWRGERDYIPLALAWASISPPHIKAAISRGLWECKAACALAEWIGSRSREELGRWHWLSLPSVCLSGSGKEISFLFLSFLYSVVSPHIPELTENATLQAKENSKSVVMALK